MRPNSCLYMQSLKSDTRELRQTRMHLMYVFGALLTPMIDTYQLRL